MSEARPPPPDPRQLLRQAGLDAKKSWGQNFLLDQRVLQRLAEATGAGPERPVIELGAGLGALTYWLLSRGGRVMAIERDREIVPHLKRALAWSDGLRIVEADAARIDWAQWHAELGAPVTVAGNLPYQLSSRILVSLADAAPHVERAVVLLQREVAERLAAEAGSRTFGLLSVLVQRRFDVELLFDVPPNAFLPRPKVTSTAVRLSAARLLDRDVDRLLVRTARAAFSARRKTLKNALAGGLGESAAIPEALLAAGIDPQRRAETLSLGELERLAAALEARGLLATDPAPEDDPEVS